MKVPPGFRVPALNDVQSCVQALSEYIPKFMAVIDPAKGTVWNVVSTARVAIVRTIPAAAKAIIAIFPHF